MYKLVIVESPAKCGKIEKYLGYGYKVMASYGHLTTLDSLANIDIENNFTPRFTRIESKAKQITLLERSIKSASTVIIATDDDREGEAIGWHICRLFQLPVNTTARIIFHEVTEPAIKRAIKNPTTLNMDTIYSQQARQILDIIVGFKITPILWKNIVTNTKNPLSAGRCQTPALRLVYDNYLDIGRSPGKTSYNIYGYFTSKMIGFSLSRDFESTQEVTQFLEDSKDFQHTFSRQAERDTTKTPPEPFITSTVQQTANTLMHISPKETMKICQRLYEQGYITYMRTDCKVYSKEFVDSVKPYIITNYTSQHIHPKIDRLHNRESNRDEISSVKVNDAKKEKEVLNKLDKISNKKNSSKESENLAQEAHEAIRPTNIEVQEIPDSEDFTSRERKLYNIIWTNTLQSCMADAEYKTFQSRITAPLTLHYSYTAETCLFRGWQEVNCKDATSKNSTKYYEFLKTLKEDTVPYKKITCQQTIKDKKLHYTEAKLVQLLEHHGIGRPSTFSSIVDKIIERKYVNVENIEGNKIQVIDYSLEDGTVTETSVEREFGNEKKKLVIQPMGILVMEFMLKNFQEICDYEWTKIMEQDLDRIAKGESPFHELCRRVNSQIDITIQERNLDHNNKIAIKIDDVHTYIIGKNGPVIKCTVGKTTSFKSIKAELINTIDMERLKTGGYQLEDIVDMEYIVNSQTPKNCLGKYKGVNLYINSGKYGPYVEWGKNRKSMNLIDKSITDITLNDAISLIENKYSYNSNNSNNSNMQSTIIRGIDKNMSIRKGKHGDYIFYKSDTMHRPEFLKITAFPDDYKKCSLQLLRTWIRETYNI